MTQKVLVADDSIASQRLFEMVLKREGYDVITISSGPEVVPAIEDKQPDLALIDAIMPDIDGYHICKTLKSNPKFKHLPIVLLAGIHEGFDRQKGMSVGSDAILDKPAKSQVIIAKVKEMLEKGEAQPENLDNLEVKAQTSKTAAPDLSVVQEPTFVEEEYAFDEDSEEVDLAVESEILDEEEAFEDFEQTSEDYGNLEEQENFSLSEDTAQETAMPEPPIPPAAPPAQLISEPTVPQTTVDIPSERVELGEIADEKLDMIADKIAERLAEKLAPVMMQEFMASLLQLPSVKRVVEETSKNVIQSLLPNLQQKMKKK